MCSSLGQPSSRCRRESRESSCFKKRRISLLIRSGWTLCKTKFLVASLRGRRNPVLIRGSGLPVMKNSESVPRVDPILRGSRTMVHHPCIQQVHRSRSPSRFQPTAMARQSAFPSGCRVTRRRHLDWIGEEKRGRPESREIFVPTRRQE